MFLPSERRKYLGGSDCAAAAGLNEYMSRYQLYQHKLGLVPPFEGNAATQWGVWMEEPLRQYACKKLQMYFRRSHVTFKHPEKEYCVAHIDGLHREAGLECKLASFRSKKKFAADGETILEPGEGLPLHYYCQVQWYMLICKKRLWYMSIGISGENEIRVLKVPYNEDFAEDLFNQCVYFWENHVRKKTPPEIEWLADANAVYKSATQASIECPPELAEDIEKLRQLQEHTSLLAERKSALEAKIKGHMRESEALVLGASQLVLATWKDVSRSVFDTKKLKEENPELHKKYSLRKCSRVFKILGHEGSETKTSTKLAS